MRPRRALPPYVLGLKRGAQEVVKRISEGEGVLTSLVHLAEVANVLEARMPLQESLEVISGLLGLKNVRVLEASLRDYSTAVEEAKELGVGASDALAHLLMREEGVSEVYSFDRDFDRLPNVVRLTR